MADLNLVEVAKINADDGIAPLIEEAVVAVPEVNQSTIPIPGTSYTTTIRTTDPTAGFRNANEGVARTSSMYDNAVVQMHYMDIRNAVDKMVADKDARGWQHLMGLEAAGNVRAQMKAIGSQFFYGTKTAVATSTADSPTKGFPGLLEYLDTSTNEVDATGTTASTGSSVWLCRFGPETMQWNLGNDGGVMATEAYKGTITIGGNELTAYKQEMEGYIGLAMLNASKAIVRIRDLTADSGKGLTDDLISDALEKFAIGEGSSGEGVVAFLSKRSRTQLQQSRTATNATGAPAPLPVESHGVPLILTSSLVDTETLNASV